MKPTIIDVADKAGVSMKTVSRVLNNERHVSAETRERVWQAINELKYSPNYLAQQFARGTSMIIGLVLFDTTWAYQRDIVISSIIAARERGYGLMTYYCDVTMEEDRNILLQTASQSRVDGYILTPPCDISGELLEELEKLSVPFVRVEPHHKELPWSYVGPSNIIGGREMTEYLISLGHRRIGMVLGPASHSATEERYQGYRDALEAHGIPVDPTLVAQGDWYYQSGLSAGRKLLTMEDRPTAVFALNDDMAIGVMNAAREMGILVPEELSVGGYDDVPMAEQNHPSLTTMRQPIREIATRAVNMLVDRLKNKDLPYAWDQLPTDLIIRESTGPCPGLERVPEKTKEMGEVVLTGGD